ncbi:MAG TPA: hypothetical protein VGC98_05145 [Thermoleophilaceae bacterium]
MRVPVAGRGFDALARARLGEPAEVFPLAAVEALRAAPAPLPVAEAFPVAAGAFRAGAAEVFSVAADALRAGAAFPAAGAFRVRAAEAFPVAAEAFPALAAEACPSPPAPPARELPRLSLRCPGRERGRLPSTPGSSLLSAATPEK